MFEFLSNKGAELLETLITPVWQWVLKLSWIGRALVLFIGCGIAFWFRYPDSMLSALQPVSCATRILVATDGEIPIERHLRDKLKGTILRLSGGLESEIRQTESDLTATVRTAPYNLNMTSWVMAQATLSTQLASQFADHQVTKVLDSKYVASFFRRTNEYSCACGREISWDSGKPRISFISGWILLALAEIGEPGTHDELRFLLNQQDHDGWWPVFVEVNGDPGFASTYVTAWAIIGLGGQLSRGFVNNEDKSSVAAAIQKGANWLHRESGSQSRWKDYPQHIEGQVSDSISGVVLHALHQSLHALHQPETEQLQQVDVEWLDNLPPSVSIDDKYQPNFWMYPKGREAQADVFVQITLPWFLIATADAYANESLSQQIKTLAWIERVLDNDSVMKSDTRPENWWRAELLYAFSYLLKRTEPPTAIATGFGGSQGSRNDASAENASARGLPLNGISIQLR
jgi:hypothetical protein